MNDSTFGMCEALKHQTQALAILERTDCPTHQRDAVLKSVNCLRTRIAKDMLWK